VPREPFTMRLSGRTMETRLSRYFRAASDPANKIRRCDRARAANLETGGSCAEGAGHCAIIDARRIGGFPSFGRRRGSGLGSRWSKESLSWSGPGKNGKMPWWRLSIEKSNNYHYGHYYGKALWLETAVELMLHHELIRSIAGLSPRSHQSSPRNTTLFCTTPPLVPACVYGRQPLFPCTTYVTVLPGLHRLAIMCQSTFVPFTRAWLACNPAQAPT